MNAPEHPENGEAMTRDIFEIWDELKAHPDYAGGYVFVREDIAYALGKTYEDVTPEEMEIAIDVNETLPTDWDGDIQMAVPWWKPE